SSITGNNVSDSTEYAIYLDGSSNNTLRNNTISDNYRGIRILNSSNDNHIYNNNFINTTGLHASVTDSTGNLFNLDAPIGGNYWDDWSGSGSYVFNGGRDDSPWADPDGWLKPDTTPPEMTPPGNTTVEATGPDGVPVDDERIKTFLASASASDNCDPQEDIIITNNAPALFPPGDTVVTFTATDTSDNSSTCQSMVTVVEAAEGHLRIIPSIINREGRLEKILAVIRFPEGTTEEDIDINQPLVLYPGDSLDGIEAINQRIVTWYWFGTLRVSVFASFSKDEVTAGVPENGPAEMMVIGRFTSGQYFYGFDNVWIISWDW
ncbi:MAG: right-handed parallel beta-helix repeat-containing protein, partial [Planctomycetes bacterium]|nr:right-handed parallel beta-helix repeat-containing protein [Planctomycetota bacterium]